MHEMEAWLAAQDEAVDAVANEIKSEAVAAPDKRLEQFAQSCRELVRWLDSDRQAFVGEFDGCGVS